MQRIKRMKDKLIEEAQSRLQNMDGGSIEQMGQIIDMIKDLSEAEKSSSRQSITTASSTPWKMASVMATMAKAVIPVGAKVTMSHI